MKILCLSDTILCLLPAHPYSNLLVGNNVLAGVDPKGTPRLWRISKGALVVGDSFVDEGEHTSFTRLRKTIVGNSLIQVKTGSQSNRGKGDKMKGVHDAVDSAATYN